MKLTLLFTFVLFGGISFTSAVLEQNGVLRRSRRSLRTDLDEFLALIPTNKIKDIYQKYKKDPNIEIFQTYLESEDFAKALKKLSELQEAKDLFNYLEAKDIQVMELTNKFAKIFDFRQGSNRLQVKPKPLDKNGSISQFFSEVRNVIPTHKLFNLFLRKLKKSPDFKEFFSKLQKVDFQQIYDNALTYSEVVDMINIFKSFGIDIENYLRLLREVFSNLDNDK